MYDLILFQFPYSVIYPDGSVLNFFQTQENMYELDAFFAQQLKRGAVLFLHDGTNQLDTWNAKLILQNEPTFVQQIITKDILEHKKEMASFFTEISPYAISYFYDYPQHIDKSQYYKEDYPRFVRLTESFESEFQQSFCALVSKTPSFDGPCYYFLQKDNFVETLNQHYESQHIHFDTKEEWIEYLTSIGEILLLHSDTSTKEVDVYLPSQLEYIQRAFLFHLYTNDSFKIHHVYMHGFTDSIDAFQKDFFDIVSCGTELCRTLTLKADCDD